MVGRLLTGLVGTVAVLGAGGFIFIVLSMFMTGADLRIRANMAVFITGTALIVIAVAITLIVYWKWVLR